MFGNSCIWVPFFPTIWREGYVVVRCLDTESFTYQTARRKTTSV